ncbi:MAG: hypothetical protein WDZ83_02745 [Rhizobiaceae bacterium]
MADGDWLRIDERTDVLVSLIECIECIRRVSEEPAFWKWAILSMHSALQGAMVCHLSGTAQLGALSKKSWVETIEWHEKDHQQAAGDDAIESERKPERDAFPDQRLADPATLFERLYRKTKRCEGAGEPLEVMPAQRSSFRRLNNLRRQFAHFAPAGWSIELAGLPRMLLDVLAVIDAIASDPWPFRHMEYADKQRLGRILKELRLELEAINL